jgi:isoquinoline 1-oxidoreductase subunit beta
MATARGKISRRTLIKGGLTVGAGLVVGFEIPRGRRAALAQQAPGLFTPNQWITIDRDGLVTIVNSVVEMGQGSLTTMPMIVADELDADLGQVKVEQAPTNPALYANPITKSQSYGGSRGVRDHMQMLRKAGAAAREMLVQAAAQEWGVPIGEVTTEPGVAVHKPTGRRLPYGALVDKASQLPVPQDPKLKTRDQFRYIGKIVHRRDTPLKVNGTAIFGMDVQVPGMLIASIERCPVFNGEVKSFDATAAKRVKGVSQVVKVSNGIAVVADSFWSALQGRKALKVTWDEGALARLTSAQISSGYAAAATQPGQEARKDGDAGKALAAAGKVVEAIYEVPFLEHACMEPMNATAHVRTDSCEIWAPTQNPGGTQQTGARLTGLPPQKVTVNTTFLGGGFGRRGEQDFITDAVETSKAVGAPVKVIWTREDDIRFDFYHATAAVYHKAAVDAKGRPTAWLARTAFQPIASTFVENATEPMSMELDLGFTDLPYDVPNLRAENGPAEANVRIGWFRAVTNNFHVFASCSFVDEMAHAAGRDPLEFLLDLLGPNRHIDLKAQGVEYANYGVPIEAHPIDTARLRRVIEVAAEKAGWATRPKGNGRGMGIAAHRSFNSYVASVVEVVTDARGGFTVPRIEQVIDAGLIVNPDRVRAQLEGAAVMAIGLARNGAITAAGGRIQQSNFNDFPVARMSDAPVRVNVTFVDSGAPPTGVGEPGVPPVIAALGNALFAATGKRVRELPITPAPIA